MKQVPAWLEMEIRWAALGERPNPLDCNTSAYLALLSEWNTRKAEAISIEGELEPIQAVKLHMVRGDYGKVGELLKTMAQQSSEPETELLFEQARLMAFEGRWQAGLDVCNQIVKSCAVGITKLSTYQVRSTCLYELKQLEASLRDIETVDSLGALYPEAFALFYARMLKVKILHIQGKELEARALLDKYWQISFSENKMDLDRLLTLLRIEFAIRMHRDSESAIQFAVAAYHVADIIGDKLYTAFSILDLSILLPNDDFLRGQIREYAFRFARIQSLVSDIYQSRSATTSGGELLKLKGNSFGSARIDLTNRPASLVLCRSKKVIQLFPFIIRDVSKYNQSLRATKLISDFGEIARQDLFTRITTQSKFVKHLHDDYISKIISRIRSLLKIETIAKNGLVRLKNVLVLK